MSILLRWTTEVWRDLRHGARLLARAPGFAVTAVLTLSLGIGSTTAAFSIVRGALLVPLPYRAPGEIGDVLDASVREAHLSKLFASYGDFTAWSRDARTLDDVAAVTWRCRHGP